mmetsp:Transcript_48364/g.101041  ORF Transcript_48364/g.101041 Transcript_48364/m.101041 type:complete len:147 (-) Transcript_48364:510-950(-)
MCFRNCSHSLTAKAQVFFLASSFLFTRLRPTNSAGSTFKIRQCESLNMDLSWNLPFRPFRNLQNYEAIQTSVQYGLNADGMWAHFSKELKGELCQRKIDFQAFLKEKKLLRTKNKAVEVSLISSDSKFLFLQIQILLGRNSAICWR